MSFCENLCDKQICASVSIQLGATGRISVEKKLGKNGSLGSFPEFQNPDSGKSFMRAAIF